MWTYNYSNELYHHGVKGMKWGVRRYQNENGTLTAKGRSKYGVKDVNEYAHLKELHLASNTDRILQMKSRKTWNKERNKALSAYRSQQKLKRQSEDSSDLTKRFNKAKAEHKNLTYNKIYNSAVGKQVASEYLKSYGDQSFKEDPSYYREVEDRYLKKLGF